MGQSHRKILPKNDIITRDSYPALSKQVYLKNISKTNLNYSEEVSEKILWLPSSTNLTDNQIEKICTTINIFFNTFEERSASVKIYAKVVPIFGKIIPDPFARP